MPPTAPTPTPAHAHAPASAPDTDELRFDFNGLASRPYSLYPWILGLYRGDALLVGGYSSWSPYLVVPPNTAAVILLDDSSHLTLSAGTHVLARELKKKWPVGVQFVNLQHQPSTYTVKMKSWGQLELEIGLRVLIQVTNAEQVTHWTEPLADVESIVKQAVVTAAANNSYEDCLRRMPEILTRSVRPLVTASCEARGLTVTDMVITHLEPDKQHSEMLRNDMLEIERMKAEIKKYEQQREVSQQQSDLKEEQSQREHQQKMRDYERREAEEKRRREVELLAAQVEEDINAMLQPARKRSAITELNKIMGTRSFEIRLKSIEALQSIVNAILEERARYPGQLASLEDNQVLNDALTMLKDWAAPMPQIPSPPVRSYLAMDKHPEPPPVAEPIKPDGPPAS